MDLEILSLTAIWNRVEFKNPLFNKSQVSLSLAQVQSKEVDQSKRTAGPQNSGAQTNLPQNHQRQSIQTAFKRVCIPQKPLTYIVEIMEIFPWLWNA